MPRYRAEEHLPYFCTITILDWLPIFIDARYIDPLIDSLRFCREKKGLQLFAFVVMPNHLHLIAGADDDLHAIMRDFKRFTSRTIHERLAADGRKTLLTWLADAAESARGCRGEFSLWRPGFEPRAIYSRSVLKQKLDYLHGNPVRKGLVSKPEDWFYSSASFYAGDGEVCTPVDILEL
jgi:REP element-mobilizing transposase RayT